MATRSLAVLPAISFFGEAGLPFRATKDFDIVLCVEVVNVEFGTVFADFLEAGGYRARERSTGRREFYRFHRPADETFPAMIELFARRPDTLKLPNGAELSPIPVEEDVVSLSAILLDEDYFEALQKARRVIDDISGTTSLRRLLRCRGTGSNTVLLQKSNRFVPKEQLLRLP